MNSPFTDAMASFKDNYQIFLHQESIYKILTEATYNADPLATGQLGHPQDNWSELVTSTVDVMLGYPEEFGRNVSALPEDQRTLIKGLLDHSLQDMGRSIAPGDQGAALRNQISAAHNKFLAAAA